MNWLECRFSGLFITPFSFRIFSDKRIVKGGLFALLLLSYSYIRITGHLRIVTTAIDVTADVRTNYSLRHSLVITLDGIVNY